mgnify:FL=1
MKKQKLCVLLCAAMMLVSSLPAFAANPVLEESPVEPMGPAETFEIPYAPLHFVDKEGNPVQGLVFSELTLNHFTDANGLNEIDVGAATDLYDGGYSGEQKVDFSNPVVFSVTNPVNGEMKKYNVLLDDDKTTKLVWDKETPTQSLEKKKEKVFFRVIDQNGKPVTDAQFVLPLQQSLQPTDTNGKTYYYGEPFEKYSVNLFYKDAKGNDQYISKLVTVREKHLKNGKMGITFKVTI